MLTEEKYMNPVTPKLGLVLSGGGAKGAYEVGVLKAMAHLGLEPSVVSGASIGALNGAVVAAAPDLKTASEQLEVMWTGIDSNRILSLEAPNWRYIALSALHITLVRRLTVSNPIAAVALLMKSAVWQCFTNEDKKYFGLLERAPLEQIIEAAVDFETLLSDKSRDFYVSVFPSTDGRGVSGKAGVIIDGIRCARSKESVFMRFRDSSRDDALNLLLASAALPLAFRSVKIGDIRYRDGGMGDRLHCQGNTPMEPLVHAGCTHAVVVTLSEGALWNRHEWDKVIPLEIRPSIPIEEKGGIKSTLDFSQERIRYLIAKGEEDARQTIGKAVRAIRLVEETRESRQAADGAMRDWDQDWPKYIDATRKSDAFFSRNTQED